MELNEKQIKFISHSLGINMYYAKRSNSKADSVLPDKFYRNYYCYHCAGEKDQSVDSFVLQLEENKIIIRDIQRGYLYFFVTDKGQELFRELFKKEVTDKFVPLSKSKQTYQDYIDSEMCEDFAFFLGIKEPYLESRSRNENLYYEGKQDYRMVSTKYHNLTGEWCKTQKDAKISYKKMLKIRIKHERGCYK